MKTKYTVVLDKRVAELLAVLDEDGDVQQVIEKLIDHVQQGVYRPGAWERQWVQQAFGYDNWVRCLESGDPYGREGCEHIFQKPKKQGCDETSQ